MDPHIDPGPSTLSWDWDLDPDCQLVDLSGHVSDWGELFPPDWKHPLQPWTESTQLRPDHGAHTVPSDPREVQTWGTVSADVLEVDRVLSLPVFAF